jgi:hypothetical protein
VLFCSASPRQFAVLPDLTAAKSSAEIRAFALGATDDTPQAFPNSSIIDGEGIGCLKPRKRAASEIVRLSGYGLASLRGRHYLADCSSQKPISQFRMP